VRVGRIWDGRRYIPERPASGSQVDQLKIWIPVVRPPFGGWGGTISTTSLTFINGYSDMRISAFHLTILIRKLIARDQTAGARAAALNGHFWF